MRKFSRNWLHYRNAKENSEFGEYNRMEFEILKDIRGEEIKIVLK